MSRGTCRRRYWNVGRSGPVAECSVRQGALTKRSALDRALPVLLLALLTLALVACDGGAPVCIDDYIGNKATDTNDGA